eukprot:243347_1
MEKLTQNVSQLSDTIQQIQLDESKEDPNTLQMSEMMKQMSVLRQQMNEVLSANSQPKQRSNPDHERVRKWLRNEVNLEQYYALFIENGFEDLESIKSLNMEILNMMQIDKIGHKMKILRCVAKLNHPQNEGTTAYI